MDEMLVTAQLLILEAHCGNITSGWKMAAHNWLEKFNANHPITPLEELAEDVSLEAEHLSKQMVPE